MSRFRGAWQSLNFDKEYLFGFETLGILSMHKQLLKVQRERKLEIASYDPFKGTVHPKINDYLLYEKIIHPQVIKNVDEFVPSFVHYITCSQVDPLQRMGAVKIRDQTAD